jgi:hypothetical protein
MLMSAGERPTALVASIANDELPADEVDVALVVDALDALFRGFAARSNCASRLCWLSPDTERLTTHPAAKDRRHLRGHRLTERYEGVPVRQRAIGGKAGGFQAGGPIIRDSACHLVDRPDFLSNIRVAPCAEPRFARAIAENAIFAKNRARAFVAKEAEMRFGQCVESRHANEQAACRQVFHLGQTRAVAGRRTLPRRSPAGELTQTN